MVLDREPGEKNIDQKITNIVDKSVHKPVDKKNAKNLYRAVLSSILQEQREAHNMQWSFNDQIGEMTGEKNSLPGEKIVRSQ